MSKQRASALKKTQGLSNKQKGGDEINIASYLEVPIVTLWTLILQKKHIVFEKRIVPMARQIADVIYKGCPTDGRSCKTIKKEKNSANSKEGELMQTIRNQLKLTGGKKKKSPTKKSISRKSV